MSCVIFEIALHFELLAEAVQSRCFILLPIFAARPCTRLKKLLLLDVFARGPRQATH